MTPNVLYELEKLGSLPIAAFAQDGKKTFRAGAYAIDVTPTKFPVSVNGGFTDRQATGAHDRLHARCLVLDDGSTPNSRTYAHKPSQVSVRGIQYAADTGIVTMDVLAAAGPAHVSDGAAVHVAGLETSPAQ